MKRIFDFSVSLFGLIAFLPFAPFVMLAIMVESPGSPVFAQRRVGKDEVPFTIYKFRTMRLDSASVPTHEMEQNKVLKVGQLLRKTKIDEVPQLVNVLLGQMSLVGPRPCLETQKELIEARRAKSVYTLTPGITGLAQVQGIDMSDPKLLARTDALYLKTRNFKVDFKLILATIFGPRFLR